jgi:hypothetical protein
MVKRVPEGCTSDEPHNMINAAKPRRALAIKAVPLFSLVGSPINAFLIGTIDEPS